MSWSDLEEEAKRGAIYILFFTIIGCPSHVYVCVSVCSDDAKRTWEDDEDDGKSRKRLHK